MNALVQRIKTAQPQTHLTSTFLGCLTAMSEGDLSLWAGQMPLYCPTLADGLAWIRSMIWLKV